MWQLVFSGELVTGYEHREVLYKLARLLGEKEAVVERTLFGKEPVVFKEVEREEDALAWRDRFAAAGAVLLVVPEDARSRAWPYVGHKLRVTYLHEPTPSSMKLRLPYIRQRNHAFVILGGMILTTIVVLVLLNWFMGLIQ